MVKWRNGLLSKVEAQAYNIKYQWNPKSKFINVTSNLWSTHTISNTNSAGGFPNYANAIWELADPDASPIIRCNTAVASNRENRFGFDVSNQMMLSDELELTMSARYQYHKIRSEDEYEGLHQMVGSTGHARVDEKSLKDSLILNGCLVSR